MDVPPRLDVTGRAFTVARRDPAAVRWYNWRVGHRRKEPDMPLDGEYEPSPWEPISEQVALYESTDGAEGNEFLGGLCIILTSRGAKSGKLRKTPLIRISDGTRYGVVGSMGGAPSDPQWVHNLRADPLVALQDGPVRREYTVHQTEGDERTEWWTRATEVWPDYDEYQRSTDRVIPLFVLEPVD